MDSAGVLQEDKEFINHNYLGNLIFSPVIERFSNPKPFVSYLKQNAPLAKTLINIILILLILLVLIKLKNSNCKSLINL